MKRYYFLVFANFLAAIGGGIILSAGIGALKGTFLEGSILAFFAGAVIGLLLHRIVRERWSRIIAPWFSISVGGASIILFELFKVYAVNGRLSNLAEIFFIALLSVRFGLWFFSRALRAQIVGRRKQGVALIELGYYAGVALGLIIWGLLDYGMLSALLVDAMLQTVAGLVDLVTIRRRYTENQITDFQRGEQAPQLVISKGNIEIVGSLTFDYRWYWRLALAILCLTIGFQAVPFSVSHWDTNGWSTYIVACFYLGVALSALVCRAFKIKFDWDSINSRWAGNATISSERSRIKLKTSFGLIILMAATSMVIALLGIQLWHWSALPVMTFIALAAFIYQILVLSLLDQIGRAEKLANLNEMIMRTYLIVAIGTIISIGILSPFSKSYYSCVLLTLVCSLVSFSVVRKRIDVHA